MGPKLNKLNLPNLTLDTQNDMCSISTSDSDCIVTVTDGKHCPPQVLGAGKSASRGDG